VWQVAARVPGIGVQQYPVERDIVAERSHRAAQSEPTSSGALHPASPEEAVGVPAAEQLTVRDTAGKVYLPLQITLQESRFEPQHEDEVRREAPAEAIVEGVIWTAFIVFASDRDAPAT